MSTATAVKSPAALGYFRVSTMNQAGERYVSLEIQEASFRAYCTANGLTPIATITDVQSGRRDDRRRPRMKNRIWDIVGPLTGVVFVVLLFIGFGISGDVREDFDDFHAVPSAAEAASVLEDRRDQVGTGSYISLFGVAFFFGFLAYFRSRLQQAESEGGWLTSMAYGGGLVTAVVSLGWISLDLAMTAVRITGRTHRLQRP